MTISSLSLAKSRHISSKPPSFLDNLQWVYSYRSFFLLLTLRLTFSRYRETIFGWGWLFVRIILPAIMSNFIFQNVMNIGTDKIPYPLFFLAGNAVWGLIVSGGRVAARCIRIQRNLLNVTTFPAAILPISYQLATLIEFVISLIIIIALIIFYYLKDHVLYLNVSPSILLAPVFLLGPIILGISLSMFTSLLTYLTRDIRMLIPKIFQAWIFVTPILYPLEKVPQKYTWIIYLNPLTFFIEAFRASLLGYGIINPLGLLYSTSITLLLFISGFYFFSRVYRTVVAIA